MPCTPIVGGFACSRGSKKTQPRRYCVVCLREGKTTPAPLLCDFRSAAGAPTCDKGLCAEHAVHRGFRDFCPDHPHE